MLPGWLRGTYAGGRGGRLSSSLWWSGISELMRAEVLPDRGTGVPSWGRVGKDLAASSLGLGWVWVCDNCQVRQSLHGLSGPSISRW